MAPAKASTRATTDSRVRSICRARTISSSQSNGPSNPSTASTGADTADGARGGSSQAATSAAMVSGTVAS
jgi:hypothetical protein